MKETTITRELSFSTLSVRTIEVGEDILLVVEGGRAHIGGCVMSIPRPSLKENGEISCTSSVLNVVGHKDEVILRVLSEAKCRTSGKIVTCVGGFHSDHITEEQIQEVQAAICDIIKEF